MNANKTHPIYVLHVRIHIRFYDEFIILLRSVMHNSRSAEKQGQTRDQLPQAAGGGGW